MAVKNRCLPDDKKYQLIKEFLDSDLDLKSWCMKNGIGESTIYEWKRLLKKRGYSFPTNENARCETVSSKNKYLMICSLLDTCENSIDVDLWCKINGVHYERIILWKKELDKKGYPFDKYQSSSLNLITHSYYYNNSNYDSCFDFNPIGQNIYGRSYKNKSEAPIYLYPGNEEYKWIVFRWDSDISVIETARYNGMDVWLWDRDNCCWSILMRYKDTDKEFWEENKERLDFYKVDYKKEEWTYLGQFLVNWSDEEIEAMEKDYWEKVSSYNGAKL